MLQWMEEPVFDIALAQCGPFTVQFVPEFSNIKVTLLVCNF